MENSQDPFITKILQRNLNADPIMIRKNNTYRMLETHHEQIKKLDIPFLLICGAEDSWRTSATDFQAALRERGIRCELKMVPGVGHNLQGLTKAEGLAAAQFQNRVFGNGKASE